MRGISTGIPGGYGARSETGFSDAFQDEREKENGGKKIRERDPSSVIKREKLHIPFDREENVESTDVPSKKKKRKKKEEKRESETVKKKNEIFVRKDDGKSKRPA